MHRGPPRACGPQGATISHSVYDVAVQATTEIEDTAIQPSRLRPIAATTTLFVAIVIAAFAASARHTGGHLIYALDDPYIHMAMARNVALHGVWGVTASHFTSSSSSLLWTAGVAALFRAFGVHESIPLLLNVGFGILLLWLMVRYLAESTVRFSNAYLFMAATGIALVAPLPALVFAGQEHILHALMNLAFVACGASWLAQPGRAMPANAARTLCAVATLLPLIRFESLFVIALVVTLLAVQGRWRAAVLIGTCGVGSGGALRRALTFVRLVLAAEFRAVEGCTPRLFVCRGHRPRAGRRELLTIDAAAGADVPRVSRSRSLLVSTGARHPR
jgi:hypothetical protein